MSTNDPKEKSIDRIIVVSAAIVNVQAKRLFVQRRDGNTSYPWHWCTPGGKAQDDELRCMALRRELCEEHKVLLMELPNEIVYEHNIASTRTGDLITVRCYRIDSTHVYGSYAAGPSVAGFDWVTANELETLVLTPADDANRGKLIALIR